MSAVAAAARPPVLPSAAAEALTVAIEAATATGRPPASVRTAIAVAHTSLWTCRRLQYAALECEAAAAVAGYLGPRLLLDGAYGLADALTTRGRAADRLHARVRRLEAAAGAPGARARAVAERLRALAHGEDRLARPLTAVPPQALTQPLGALVHHLEEARSALLHRMAALYAPDAEDIGHDGRWALADRYALLTAVAAALDGWRVPGAPRSRLSGDRMCLVAALTRLTGLLGGPAPVPPEGMYDDVYEVAVTATVVHATRRTPTRPPSRTPPTPPGTTPAPPGTTPAAVRSTTPARAIPAPARAIPAPARAPVQPRAGAPAGPTAPARTALAPVRSTTPARAIPAPARPPVQPRAGAPAGPMVPSRTALTPVRTTTPSRTTPAPSRTTPAPSRTTPAPARATPAPVRSTTPAPTTHAPSRATPAPARPPAQARAGAPDRAIPASARSGAPAWTAPGPARVLRLQLANRS
ncbi:hypothetical protein GCM10023237_39070 [Streptomyces coeruleoprunus]